MIKMHSTLKDQGASNRQAAQLVMSICFGPFLPE
jgi:hypothetical protein